MDTTTTIVISTAVTNALTGSGAWLIGRRQRNASVQRMEVSTETSALDLYHKTINLVAEMERQAAVDRTAFNRMRVDLDDCVRAREAAGRQRDELHAEITELQRAIARLEAHNLTSAAATAATGLIAHAEQTAKILLTDAEHIVASNAEKED